MGFGSGGRFGRATTTADILRTLATLAPASRRALSYDVTTSGAPLLWLGTTQSVLAHSVFAAAATGYDVVSIGASAEARRLAAVDALHAEERLLREGWIFLCGRARVGERHVTLCTPILSQPVRLRRGLTSFAVLPAGDTELTPLVQSSMSAERLEAHAQYGGGALFDQTNAPDALINRLTKLHEWINQVADAAGLRVGRIVGPSHDPLQLRHRPDITAVVGVGIFAVRDVNAVDVASSLHSWAGQPLIGETALASLYGTSIAPRQPEPQPSPQIQSPLPLTHAQRNVVAAARHQPVTVVSGPPGCGKSHTLVATALDAVAQGQSVLVATQSSYAAEVLATLLDRYPGPTPVVFGDAEHREALAGRIERALEGRADSRHVTELERRVARARSQVELLEQRIAEAVEREALAADPQRWLALIAAGSARYPGLFDPGADPAQWQASLDRLEKARGVWRRWRARRAFRKLTALAEPPADLAAAIEAARARRGAALLETEGGTVLAPTFETLNRADADLRDALGALLAAQATNAIGDGRSRSAVAALAGAMRASRPRRRELLRRLDAKALVRALPLWVGTLSDIEHLLPVAPGLFDLILLDEASQIDQRSAPPALLRARRAVIAGDPRQLRHVSFVGDEAVTTAIEEQGSSDAAHLLDVRRMSTYDVAAGAAPVQWLSDHFRSVPHLIEFSAGRFYDGRVTLLTRQPSTECADVIDAQHVEGARDAEGVNRAEVAAVAARVQQLARDGAHSVGVITPFRAQADALEHMLLESFDLEHIEALGLRVGTVHQFQGNERDHIVVSIAVGPDEPAASRRFVEDPNLFNVMVTRARRSLDVIVSPGLTSGLVAAYVEYASAGPQPPPPVRASDPWVAGLAAELTRCGLQPRTGYPVGRWRVDIAVDTPDGPVALDCTVPDGDVAEHLEMHRELHAFGWRFVDGYASRFGGDAAAAALTLAGEIGPVG